MRIHRDERGQTIILVALSLPLLLGFVGIATDVGALFKDKRTMQTAADAAAIAGALQLNAGNFSAAAQAAATANGYTDGSSGVHVTPVNGPLWPASNYHLVQNYIEVTITKTEPTIFLALFGHPSVTVLARAVATNQAKGSGCLFTVGTTGTGFRNNGTVDVEATQCGLVVESSDPNAMVLHGSSDTVNLGSIGIVGGDSLSGSPKFPTAQPQTGIAPESDPLNFLPQFSFTNTGGTNPSASVSCATNFDCSKSPVSVPSTCQFNATGKKGALSFNIPVGATLNPGCYTTLNFPSSGTVTMTAGLYIVDGDVNLSGSAVTGNGVTFYTNGSYNFGSGTYTLTAPNNDTSSTPLLFNGILFAESLDDTNGITFGGNSSTVIKGVVYAPAASFDMHGNPSIQLFADFVVHDITLSGNVSFNSFAALSGVASPLTSIALVE